MLTGFVDARGAPVVVLDIAGREWLAIIDTGFNGHFELPIACASAVNPEFLGRGRSTLAGDQTVAEDYYTAQVPFDGRIVDAVVSFVRGQEILVGTRVLETYRLEIDFPRRTVSLVRAQ